MTIAIKQRLRSSLSGKHRQAAFAPPPQQAFLIAVLLLGGCAVQTDYVQPDLPSPASWTVTPTVAQEHGQPLAPAWWTSLGDSAINRLIDKALLDNPTLDEALTRIDEARATVGVNAAAGLPTVTADAGLSRAKSGSAPSQPAGSMLTTSASAGVSLGWEIDLFGRLRNATAASRYRLNARSADAASTRLTLASDIATGVLQLRACLSTRHVYIEDIISREKTLALTRLRLKAGVASTVDEARAASGIAASRTSLASQEEQCARQVNALVALSGQSADMVRKLVGTTDEYRGTGTMFMPSPPAAVPQIPAMVLAGHPDVVSAEQELAAAWAEIGVARANRLPRLDLGAVLTGQWIRAAGSTVDATAWSMGPGLTASLFDGGAGRANVDAAQARYRRALTVLQHTLRSTVQDVENALAAQASATARLGSSHDGVIAAGTTLRASEAQWQVGAISLFELEDSRRQFTAAQDAEISATRDQGQSWISLIKATGVAVIPSTTDFHE